MPILGTAGSFSCPISFAALTVEELRAAYATSEAHGLTLEAVLVERLDPEFVSFVRDAQSLANASCERCGRERKRLHRHRFGQLNRCQCPHLASEYSPLQVA